MRLGTLQSYYSGYRINWELFFRTYLDKPVNQEFEICHVDLDPEVSKVLADTDINALRKFISFHVIFNTEASLMYQNQISIFSFGTSVYNSIFLQKDLESNCLNLIKMYFPISSTIHTPLKKMFERQTKTLFTNIKSVLVDTIDSIYWIPSEQRRGLMESVKNVSLAYDWSGFTGKSLKSFYAKIPGSAEYMDVLQKALKLKFNYLSKGKHVSRIFGDALTMHNQWNRKLGKLSLHFLALSDILNYFAQVGVLTYKAVAMGPHI